VADGFLRFAEVPLGSGGFPSCTRCTSPEAFAPRPAADVIAEALEAIESWDHATLGPGPNIVFAGAEPFSHPELPSVIFAAAEAGASRISLRTSGEALSLAENAAGVIHAGVRHVEVVLLGDGDHHQLVTGRPGSFAAISQGVRALADAAREQHVSVAVSGRVPVCRHNLEHVPAAVAALSELGASEVVLEVGVAAASSAEGGRWLASACDTGVVNGTWVSVSSSKPSPQVPSLHLVGVTTTSAAANASAGDGR
jgi:hypothetical protein